MLKLLVFESLLFLTSVECPLLDFSLNFLDLLPIPISGTSLFGVQVFPLFTCTLILLTSIYYEMELDNPDYQNACNKAPSCYAEAH